MSINKKNIPDNWNLEEQYHKLEKQYQNLLRENEMQLAFVQQLTNEMQISFHSLEGISELVREHIDNHVQINNYMDSMEKISQFLSDAFQNILGIASLDSSRLQREKYLTDLSYLISDACNACREEAAKKQLHLEMDTSKLSHKLVYCDSYRIKQMLINLLNCSIIMSAEGTISLTAEQAEDFADNKAVYRFTVTDQGRGYSPEVLTQLFEPFPYQVKEDDLKDVFASMYVTRSMASMYQGSIQVNSKEGEGSRVIMELTLTCQEKQVESDESVIRGKHVLLVEDNELTGDIAKIGLESLGLHVDRATDGQVALDMLCEFDSNYFDIIIMDIRMPNMNGYEAASLIRSFSNQRISKLPILAFSAYASPVEVSLAEAQVMDGFVSKPFSREEAARVIGDVLQKSYWRF